MERGGEAVDDPEAWFDALPEKVASLWQAYWRVEWMNEASDDKKPAGSLVSQLDHYAKVVTKSQHR